MSDEKEKATLSLEELHATREWQLVPTEQMRTFVDTFIASGSASFAYQTAYGSSELVARKACYSIMRRKAIADVLNRWRNVSDAELAIETLRSIVNDKKAPASAKTNAAAALARLAGAVIEPNSESETSVGPENPETKIEAPKGDAAEFQGRVYHVGDVFEHSGERFCVVRIKDGWFDILENLTTGKLEKKDMQ